MTTPSGKRKLPRRELPWIGPLLDTLPFSKLPTNHTVLQRLCYEIESDNGTASLDNSSITVKNELIDLWVYAGYGDILHDPSYIRKQLKSLHLSYKSLSKTPLSRRDKPSFLTKEASFLSTLPQLFNITVESLRYSQLITTEDRDFLLNHWDKKISSTRDIPLQRAVTKKLEREEKRARFFAESIPSPAPPSTPSSRNITSLLSP